MTLSPETIKPRQEREAQSKELHNPTPEQKAEEAQYWRDNVALRARLDKARMAQAAKLERLRKGRREQFETLKKHFPGVKVVRAADPKKK
jgi:hypothetical protein